MITDRDCSQLVQDIMVTVCECTTGPVLIITENMVGLYIELENFVLVESIYSTGPTNVSLLAYIKLYSMTTCNSFWCMYNCYISIYTCRLTVESRANSLTVTVMK